MKVIKVSPRGYCLGVVQSIKMARNAVKQYPDHKIYMLGYLVHNQFIVEELKQLGIEPINDFMKNRCELIKLLPNKSVVILSAHGSPDQIKMIAEEKEIILIDTECEWVTVTKNVIKEHLQKQEEIVFIGKDHHPETKAIMAISPVIHLITKKSQVKELINKLNPHRPIFVTNQTTLSQLDIQDIIDELKSEFPERISFKNDLCYATLERQNAVLELKPHEVDLLLVVGDERSNNTLKLVEMGESIGICSYRINNYHDIKPEWLANISTVAVTAGASTPSQIQLETIRYLEQYQPIV